MMRMLFGLIAAVLVFALAWVFYLQDLPFFIEMRRPANVPKDAVFVFEGKAGVWWQHCVYSPKEDVDRCQVWNKDGGIIDSGVYLPIDGGPAVRAEQLRLRAGHGGGREICLQNGRELLPKWVVDRADEFGRWVLNPGCGDAHPPR